MNYLVKSIKEEIETKVERIDTQNKKVLIFTINQFWDFIINNPITKSIIDKLLNEYPDCKNDVDLIIERKVFHFDKPEKEVIAIAVQMISKIMEANTVKKKSDLVTYISNPIQKTKSYKESCELVKSVWIKQIEYLLISSLDKNLIIIEISSRFKIKIEQFNREKVFKLATKNSKKTEETLAKVYLEFLFDNGLDVYVEPKSTGGRVDFYIVDHLRNKSLSDAKIHDEKSRNGTYIKKGIHQLLTYLEEEVISIGFLIVFEISEVCLRFDFDTLNGIPYIDFGEKRIFIIVVDICLYDNSPWRIRRQFCR